MDYMYLNSLTVKHEYLIPIIDELLEGLNGAKFFSKIDLRSNIQGLSEAVCYGSLVHVHKVLEVLRQNKLFAKRSKCSSGQSRIEYLGHIISGVSIDPDKISCMTVAYS